MTFYTPIITRTDSLSSIVRAASKPRQAAPAGTLSRTEVRRIVAELLG